MVPEIDEVIETQEFPYEDEIYSFKNGKQIDLKVTKNHRFLVKQGQRPVTFLEASEIEKWTNMSIPRVNPPTMKEDETTNFTCGLQRQRQICRCISNENCWTALDSQNSELWEYVSNFGSL